MSRAWWRSRHQRGMNARSGDNVRAVERVEHARAQGVSHLLWLGRASSGGDYRVSTVGVHINKPRKSREWPGKVDIFPV